VDTDGRAHEVRIVRSLGMGLDEKALEAIRGWKFEPGRKDGIPVAVQVNVEVSFRLY
jgi:TonB family protein